MFSCIYLNYSCTVQTNAVISLGYKFGVFGEEGMDSLVINIDVVLFLEFLSHFVRGKKSPWVQNSIVTGLYLPCH